MTPKVIAILVSDIHLQLKAPIARSAEPDWLAAQARPLHQLADISQRHGRVPIICAGDVFDKWNSSPELINYALREMPEMYAIPGQHDLPFHSYEDMDRSAFGTLVRARRIKLLSPNEPTLIATRSSCPDLIIHAFPWGFEVTPFKGESPQSIHLAVVHAFCWTKTATYPGAPAVSAAMGFRARLKGYQAAIFGDNHKPFQLNVGQCDLFNHGAFIRRKTDERSIKPAFGLLMSDGTIKKHEQDISKDLWANAVQAFSIEQDEFRMKEFIRDLEKLGRTSLDFTDALKGYMEMHEISPGARKHLTQVIHNES